MFWRHFLNVIISIISLKNYEQVCKTKTGRQEKKVLWYNKSPTTLKALKNQHLSLPEAFYVDLLSESDALEEVIENALLLLLIGAGSFLLAAGVFVSNGFV